MWPHQSPGALKVCNPHPNQKKLWPNILSSCQEKTKNGSRNFSLCFFGVAARFYVKKSVDNKFMEVINRGRLLYYGLMIFPAAKPFTDERERYISDLGSGRRAA